MVSGRKSIVRALSNATDALFIDHQSEAIKPAQDVAQISHRFLLGRLPKLGAKVITELTAVIGYNKGSGRVALKTDEEILAGLEKTPLEQLSAYVASEIDKMKAADLDLQKKRSKGFHKVAASFQTFALTFSQFLRAYSGIVDVLEGADSQFGNVAFAALSLLFAVSIIPYLMLFAVA